MSYRGRRIHLVAQRDMSVGSRFRGMERLLGVFRTERYCCVGFLRGDFVFEEFGGEMSRGYNLKRINLKIHLEISEVLWCIPRKHLLIQFIAYKRKINCYSL